MFGTVNTAVNQRQSAFKDLRLTEGNRQANKELQCTVMCRLMMGKHCKKCVIRQFHCCMNITKYNYTNLDGIAYCLGYMVYPVLPRLQTCMACYYTEYCRQLQHSGKCLCV